MTWILCFECKLSLTIGDGSRNFICSLKTKNGPNIEVVGKRQYPMYSRKEGRDTTFGGFFSPSLLNLGSRSNPSETIRITITKNEPTTEKLRPTIGDSKHAHLLLDATLMLRQCTFHYSTDIINNYVVMLVMIRTISIRMQVQYLLQ